LPQPAALRLLGTQFLVLPERHQPEFAERIAGEKDNEDQADWPQSAALWRMKRTLPRAWIVHEVEALPPPPLRIEAIDERTKAVLFPGDKSRDFHRSAVVET